MQSKTYWQDTECHHADNFVDLFKEHLCPVLYVCIPYQLYYDSYLPLDTSFCFCINYTNEGYLHRGRVSFRYIEKCDYNKACPCKFENR